MVVDPGCMKCMDCISVCPNDALYFGFGKPTIAVPQIDQEELLSDLAGRNRRGGRVSGKFPGCSGRLWTRSIPDGARLRLGHDVSHSKNLETATGQRMSFYRFNLKSSGRIQKAGWGFLSFAVVWIGLNAHSGWVRYHEYEGDRAFQKLQIPDELALAQTNPDPWLSPIDRENILEGKNHFQAGCEFWIVCKQRGAAEACLV